MRRICSTRRISVVLFAFLLIQSACAVADDSDSEGSPDQPPESQPPSESAPFDETRERSEIDRTLRLLMHASDVDPPETRGPYDAAAVELGRKLFFDKALSGPRDTACATCHHPRAGAETGDGLALGVGTGGEGSIPDRRMPLERELVPRHSLALFSFGIEGWDTQLWDGRVQRTASGELVTPHGEKMQEGLDGPLAGQAMLPVASRVEMRGFPDDANPISQIPDGRVREVWSALMERLLSHEAYRELFREVYPDRSLEDLKFRDAANALAEYQKSAFTYLDTPFDEYLRGDDEALTRRQKRGAVVFYGKGGCASCHSGELTTDQEFHNLAVPQIGPGKGSTRPLDPGRYTVTGRPDQLFEFRTPTLRNCELTAPYMHSGAYESIEKVIEHHLDPKSMLTNYDGAQLRPDFRERWRDREDVERRLLAGLDEQIRRRAEIQQQPDHPMYVSDEEVDELIAFLRSMTSPTAREKLEEETPESVPSGLLEDGRESLDALRADGS